MFLAVSPVAIESRLVVDFVSLGPTGIIKVTFGYLFELIYVYVQLYEL